MRQKFGLVIHFFVKYILYETQCSRYAKVPSHFEKREFFKAKKLVIILENETFFFMMPLRNGIIEFTRQKSGKNIFL